MTERNRNGACITLFYTVGDAESTSGDKYYPVQTAIQLTC